MSEAVPQVKAEVVPPVNAKEAQILDEFLRKAKAFTDARVKNRSGELKDREDYLKANQELNGIREVANEVLKGKGPAYQYKGYLLSYSNRGCPEWVKE